MDSSGAVCVIFYYTRVTKKTMGASQSAGSSEYPEGYDFIAEDDAQYYAVRDMAAGIFANSQNLTVIDSEIESEKGYMIQLEWKKGLPVGYTHKNAVLAEILLDSKGNTTGKVDMTKTLKGVEKLIKAVGFLETSLSPLNDASSILTFKPKLYARYVYHALMGHICRLRGIRVHLGEPRRFQPNASFFVFRQLYANTRGTYPPVIDPLNTTILAQLVRILEEIAPTKHLILEEEDAQQQSNQTAAAVVHQLNRTVVNARIAPHPGDEYHHKHDSHHHVHKEDKHHDMHDGEMHHGDSYAKDHEHHKEHHKEHHLPHELEKH
jgi:hypothetical protein